jgi:hypothetical protein
MGATSVYQLPYPAATDPADVPTDLQELANRIEAAIVPGTANGQVPVWDNVAKTWKPQLGALSETPPASPIDGQQWAMPLSTGGVAVFRYNVGSASPYRWEFVGGPPLVAKVNTGESTISDIYTDLATVGPQITVPRAGDYLATMQAEGYSSVNGNVGTSLKKGAVAPSVVDELAIYGPNGNQTGASRVVECPGLAAGTVLQMQYRVIIAATGTFRYRHLFVIPLKVS